MTTLMLVDGGNAAERKSVAVVRRIREELGRLNISVSEVARRLDTTQQKLSRRMTGLKPWDVDELDEFCKAAGISYDYVVTGIRALPPPVPFENAPLRNQAGLPDHHFSQASQPVDSLAA